MKEKIQLTDEQLYASRLRAVNHAQDKGASSWLSVPPLKEQGFNLNKTEFGDALHLQCNMPLTMLPTSCLCGERFNVEHALTCKRGRFVTMRHDTIRDTCAFLLDKVYYDVEVDPHLIPFDNEYFHLRTANISNEARLDIKAKGFRRSGQTTFFNVRVTNVNCASNQNSGRQVCTLQWSHLCLRNSSKVATKIFQFDQYLGTGLDMPFEI